MRVKVRVVGEVEGGGRTVIWVTGGSHDGEVSR